MLMAKNKLIVISGCSGGGKSTLLTELSDNGYTVMPEVGREIVKEQLALNSNILPWTEPIRFCELLIEKSIARYHEATHYDSAKDDVIFFDRCFLEGISYFQAINIHTYDYIVNELRYYPVILMTPPWEEIYCEDTERKNSFKDAVEEYNRLLQYYVQYGYKQVTLPKASVKERYQFIIDNTK
jgi:predicted ATPase